VYIGFLTFFGGVLRTGAAPNPRCGLLAAAFPPSGAEHKVRKGSLGTTQGIPSVTSFPKGVVPPSPSSSVCTTATLFT
jgi:hypothetical protein